EQFVSQFGPGDRAAIGTFQGLPMINPQFMANPRRLLDSVAAGMNGMGQPCGVWTPWVAGFGNGRGSAVWDGIRCGIEHAASDTETPRRVVLVVSDAVDNASSNAEPASLASLADKYGVMIYGIGMAGNTVLDEFNATTLRDIA